MDFILISVPHNMCDDNHDAGEHTCDTIAEGIADYITELLSDRDIPYVLIYGDINRETMDLNRVGSRDSEFRKDLRDEFRDKPHCLLDVHSFPEGDKDFQDVDIAIGTDRNVIEPHLKDLADYLHSEEIDTIAIGKLEADIVKEAKEHGITAYLLEFNEGLDEDYQREIAENIIDFIELGGEDPE